VNETMQVNGWLQSDRAALPTLHSNSMKSLFSTVILLAVSLPILAENRVIDLSSADTKATNVAMRLTDISGQSALVVTKDAAIAEVDEPTFVELVGSDFKDGVIEVKVMSKLLADAPDFARGFIGVAFRINEDSSQFEGIYVRPTNSRAEDQRRRNATIQYFSYPDFKFDRLRRETPGQYESYVDIGLEEWITLKIEVKDERARLYVNGNQQPSLIVNDLKHGAGSTGNVGLWVDVGTEGYFTDLKIQRE